MSVVVVTSVAGAPGATSLALGLAAAWPVAGQRRVVIEADPDGGRLGAELGVGVEPGLMAVALAARSATLTADDVVRTGAAAIADWFVVPAPPSAEQSYSALVHGAPTVATVMADDEPEALTGRPPTAWFVDAGRLTARSPALPLAKVAAHVLVVTNGSFAELQLVPHRVDALRAAACHVEVVVVEPTPWTLAEIAEFVGTDVVAVLPRVRSRTRRVAAMRTNAWRPWWNAVDAVALYVSGGVSTVLADEVDDEVDHDAGLADEAVV